MPNNMENLIDSKEDMPLQISEMEDKLLQIFSSYPFTYYLVVSFFLAMGWSINSGWSIQ